MAWVGIPSECYACVMDRLFSVSMAFCFKTMLFGSIKKQNSNNHPEDTYYTFKALGGVVLIIHIYPYERTGV